MAYGSQGVNNGAALDGTVDRQLFQEKAATDVLKYFKVTNVARELITNDSISSGKSKSFPVVGNATASSRDEETLAELALQSTKATDRTISIGDLTVAHSWISDLDSAMVHYDAKSAHIESIGRALSKNVDEAIIVKVIEAGRIVDATAATTAGLRTFADDVFSSIAQDQNDFDTALTGADVQVMMANAMTEFRDKDCVGDPVFLVRPQPYFALLNNAAQTGLTWVNDPYAQSGKVPMILGAKVVYSPNFPAVDSTTGAENAYGVLFAKEAVGILELLSVSIKTDYIPTRLADLMVGKMAVGYGILNHGSAITFGCKEAA
ncbi:hypothetical protein KAU11_08140 [Candidatus Babeliales bacterium]|nr:hypothetical protein [Candidatus Babeliales bacterium]